MTKEEIGTRIAERGTSDAESGDYERIEIARVVLNRLIQRWVMNEKL